jgi:hypothetical protein
MAIRTPAKREEAEQREVSREFGRLYQKQQIL